MSKYIYCSGKIYNNENNNLYIASYETIGDFDTDNKWRLVDYLFRHGNCTKVLEHMNSYIEFDNLEDLIEVGDVFGYSDGSGVFAITRTEVQDGELAFEVNNENMCFDGDNFSSLKHCTYDEWFKRIDNTFIRICHKENNEWVID